MPRKQYNLIGQVFGRLTVIDGPFQRPQKSGHLATIWYCRCVCGLFVAVGHSNLTSTTKSCGCLRRELAAKRHTTHGDTAHGKDSPEYLAWSAMKKRCLNPKYSAYPDYGGRGITICERWINSFGAFLSDMGRRPSENERYTIERKDNDGHYCPENCKWATYKEQENNRRNNVMLTLNGESHTLSQWCELTGLRRSTISSRLSIGWSVKKALTEPPRNR